MYCYCCNVSPYACINKMYTSSISSSIFVLAHKLTFRIGVGAEEGREDEMLDNKFIPHLLN